VANVTHPKTKKKVGWSDGLSVSQSVSQSVSRQGTVSGISLIKLSARTLLSTIITEVD
jgi:hypothetical protein